jgi:hypothetical protein
MPIPTTRRTTGPEPAFAAAQGHAAEPRHVGAVP